MKVRDITTHTEAFNSFRSIDRKLPCRWNSVIGCLDLTRNQSKYPMKLEAEVRAILAAHPVLYLPGWTARIPVPISGVDHGRVWWLDGDRPHAIPSELVPVESSGGIAFKRGDCIEYVLLTLDVCDELNHADIVQAIEASRRDFERPEAKEFLATVVAALRFESLKPLLN